VSQPAAIVVLVGERVLHLHAVSFASIVCHLINQRMVSVFGSEAHLANFRGQRVLFFARFHGTVKEEFFGN
jgi:hypothetical protein